MSGYSEKQMLLLSNFIYLPASTTNRTLAEILDSYRNENGDFTLESVYSAGYGGGLTQEDVCKLFGEMDKEIHDNPEFGNISAARTLNEGNVKAICYTDPSDGNPLVVFRGTGGSNEAWSDNFEGGFEEDTKMQRLCADFVKNECGMYKDIMVTGHSKGGNLSQYVTVELSDKIQKCVSFDGQGFSNQFISENSDKIAIASAKITSINAYNDFVNILLTPIASTIIYGYNENTAGAAHSSFALLMNNEFDANGKMVSERSQSALMKALRELVSMLVEKLDFTDPRDIKLFSYIVGKTIASALESFSMTNIRDTVSELKKDISTAILIKGAQKNQEDQRSNAPQYIYTKYDFEGMKKCVEELKAVKNQILRRKIKVIEIRNSISFILSTKLYADRKLERVCVRLDGIKHSIDELAGTIELVNARYAEKERTLSELFVL